MACFSKRYKKENRGKLLRLIEVQCTVLALRTLVQSKDPNWMHRRKLELYIAPRRYFDFGDHHSYFNFKTPFKLLRRYNQEHGSTPERTSRVLMTFHFLRSCSATTAKNFTPIKVLLSAGSACYRKNKVNFLVVMTKNSRHHQLCSICHSTFTRSPSPFQ
jgi:hypothetical protein